MKNTITKKIAIGALIAAVYAVLTIAIAPLSYGVMQLRISEAMTVLPAFTPVAIPGLFVGCVISNLLSPVGIMDILLGSLASLIAAYGSHLLRHNKWLVPLPPVVVNAFIVGPMLYFYYGVDVSLIGCILWVGAGQAVVCYGLGLPLMKLLEKYRHLFD
ncbi:MAG: QueT transporter family protein [Peptostreptococcaceae bacterium]|nr:QueT transporter family protein [Peptostreptococcaceae bacterium]MDY5738470.1 QueT transporter family protein [Anaerovoracaceae bacterium]SFE62961.1 Uncharacterized membrane protein [Peptostreptococcaceae bacterium pGA-8]